MGDPDWPKDKLTAKMQAIRDERDKLLTDLDRLDADLKVARDIFTTALTLLVKPQRLYKTMTDTQRKLLNALLFTKITVDTHGVTGEQSPNLPTPWCPSDATSPDTERVEHDKGEEISLLAIFNV